MSLAGFKKQLNKANQFVSERIAGVEGTKLDHDFQDMEKKVDATARAMEEMQTYTLEYLQPNPAVRAKMLAMNQWSRIRGQVKSYTYPQAEGTLGDSMCRNGKELGYDSVYGQALIEVGDCFKQLGDSKYALEDNVKQNFLDTVQMSLSKDVKEINHHRKKLEGRRLDFDCKKRKQTKGATVSEIDIKVAEEKFVESRYLAESGMRNLLDNEVEHIAQLMALVEAELNYHRQAADLLEAAFQGLEAKKQEAAEKPRAEPVTRQVPSRTQSFTPNDLSHQAAGNNTHISSPMPASGATGFGGLSNSSAASNHHGASAPPKSPSHAPTAAGSRGPCVQAIYDFEAENPGELELKEGDLIQLTSQIDENWYEGSLNGKSGFFPISYVKVLVPLP